MLGWLRLIRAKGLRNAEALVLLHHFGDAETVCASSAAQWRSAGVEPRTLPAADDPQVLGDAAWLSGGADRHLVTFDDPRYPEALRTITTPPLALFVRGNATLLAAPQLALVGARAATPQGLENARAFGAELSHRGLIVTSGLALGVDGAAHLGALDAKAPTVAVCGTGLDRVYPARHKALAAAILDGGGALVSEFPPGTAALAQNFPSRNRILSGLSLGVLVIEASRDSGSLITARRAVEQGREVFAIPGSIHNTLARGCHQLIRQGARLVESVDDIVEELAGVLAGALADALAAEAPTPLAAEAEPARDLQSIWRAMGDEPVTVDRLVEQLQWPADKVGEALLKLELDGWVATDSAGRVMRRRRPSAT